MHQARIHSLHFADCAKCLSLKVKRVATSKLQASAANVLLEEKAAHLSCEEGKTLAVVNGTGTASSRTKCGKNTMPDAGVIFLLRGVSAYYLKVFDFALKTWIVQLVSLETYVALSGAC